jgi:hypothetical protein
MKAWQWLAAALLGAVAAAGCGPAGAQDEKAVFEHGVLEWIRYKSAKEDQERYSWATAAEETQRDTAAGLFGVLGVGADPKASAADRMCLVDHLSNGGWQLVTRTDVAYTDAGGSAIAERYLFRRRR